MHKDHNKLLMPNLETFSEPPEGFNLKDAVTLYSEQEKENRARHII